MAKSTIMRDENDSRARVNKERDKAEEGSTLNKLLNKRGSPADAIVEQTGGSPRYLSVCV